MIGLLLSSCGGDDKKPTATPSLTEAAERPETTSPPSAEGQLPEEFIECMAGQGYEIRSPDEIHSAPMEALQACFPALHGDGTQ